MRKDINMIFKELLQLYSDFEDTICIKIFDDDLNLLYKSKNIKISEIPDVLLEYYVYRHRSDEVCLIKGDF